MYIPEERGNEEGAAAWGVTSVPVKTKYNNIVINVMIKKLK
jgi:hypothetical protein